MLKKFHKAHPNVRIKLTNHSTPQALRALKSGFADIAVVTSPTGTAFPLKETIIKPIQEVAVCSSYFSELAGKKVSLKELVKYPIIMLGNDTTSYDFYSKFFMLQGISLFPEIEAATTDQILPMVKNDLGIGFVPKEFIVNDISKDNIIILDLEEAIPERNICIVKNTENHLSIVAKELERMLLDNENF